MSNAIRLDTPSEALEIARLLTQLGHPNTVADIAVKWPALVAAGITSHLFMKELS